MTNRALEHKDHNVFIILFIVRSLFTLINACKACVESLNCIARMCT